MGVDVDEAGRDQQAAGVDLLAAGRRHLADLDDRSVAHADIALEQGGAAAIGDHALADDQVEVAVHACAFHCGDLLPLTTSGGWPETGQTRFPGR